MKKYSNPRLRDLVSCLFADRVGVPSRPAGTVCSLEIDYSISGNCVLAFNKTRYLCKQIVMKL